MSDFPKFDDFLKSITPEQCRKIENASVHDIEKIKEDFKTNEFASVLSAIEGRSFKISLGLLELYHEWIAEQFQKD